MVYLKRTSNLPSTQVDHGYASRHSGYNVHAMSIKEADLVKRLVEFRLKDNQVPDSQSVLVIEYFIRKCGLVLGIIGLLQHFRKLFAHVAVHAPTPNIEDFAMNQVIVRCGHIESSHGRRQG